MENTSYPTAAPTSSPPSVRAPAIRSVRNDAAGRTFHVTSHHFHLLQVGAGRRRVKIGVVWPSRHTPSEGRNLLIENMS